MWKDYFSFNKRQRNGIVVLLCIIVLMISWLFISEHLPPEKGTIVPQAFKPEHADSVRPGKALSQLNLIELNSANLLAIESNETMRSHAKAIIAYREKLGGFTDKRQLLEAYQFDSAEYRIISSAVNVDSTKIRKLSLNTASIKQLAKHPYIGYFTAQAIVNYREQHGEYKQLKDLLKNAAIDNITFNKLAPYLSLN
jgi:competence ComEA-like helix-hairpin-helix protein